MHDSTSPLVRGLSFRVRAGALLGAMALASYFALTYSGPHRWLAEVAMRYIGGYYGVAVWTVSWILLVVPLLMLCQLARRAGLLADAKGDEGGAAFAAKAQRLAEIQDQYLLPLISGLAGLMLLCLSAWLWFDAASARELVTVDVEAIERGQATNSTWLEVRGGEPLWESSVEQERGAVRTHYVPLVSAERGEGHAVVIVLSLNDAQQRELPRDSAAFRGLRESLPGPVRVAFEEAGFDMSHAFTLAVGEDPHGIVEIMIGLGGMGATALLVSVGALVRRKRRRGG